MRSTSVTQNSKKVLDKCLKKVGTKVKKELSELYVTQIFSFFDLLAEPLYVSIDGRLPEERYFHDFFSSMTLLTSLPMIRWFVTPEDLKIYQSEIEKFSLELQKGILGVIAKEEEKQPFLRHVKPKDFQSLKTEVTTWLSLRGNTQWLAISTEGQLSQQILGNSFAQVTKAGSFLAEGLTLLTQQYRGDGMFTIGRLLHAIGATLWKTTSLSLIEKFYSGKMTIKEANSPLGRYIFAQINETAPLTGLATITYSPDVKKAAIEEALILAKRLSLKRIMLSEVETLVASYSIPAAIEDFKDLLKDFSESNHRIAAKNFIIEVTEEVNQAD